MSTQTQTRTGWLANAFAGSRWDSRIRSANTTRKEMWLGYFLGVWGMAMTNSIVNSYFNQYLTDVIGFDSTKADRADSTKAVTGDVMQAPKAQCDLICPGRPDQFTALMAGLESGAVRLEDVKRSAARVLKMVRSNTVVKSR